MPYFRRPPLSSAIPDLGGGAAASTVLGGIVDRAGAILDQESVAKIAGPMSTPFEGAGNGSLPPADLPAIGELQKRAGEVLSDLLALVTQSTQTARPTDKVDSVGGSYVLPVRGSRAPTSVAVIGSQQPAKAGESTIVSIPLVNEGSDSVQPTLYCTDFISDSGHEIPALRITFSPRTLVLSGHAAGKTDMQVAIPAQCAPGSYSALVQASGLSGPRAVVVLLVE